MKNENGNGHNRIAATVAEIPKAKKSKGVANSIPVNKTTHGMVDIVDDNDDIVPQTKMSSVALEIRGTSSLIQNNFSQKAIEQMLRGHMGLPNLKEPKKPMECIERAKIVNTNGDICVPIAAIKKAMLTASGTMKSQKKTNLRQTVFVEGQSLRLRYEKMVPRMDIVRLAGVGRTPDIRFRPEFHNWRIRLIIEFADVLNSATITDMLNRAGNVGLCEWRPEKNGIHGRFVVARVIANQKEVDEVRADNSFPVKPLVIPSWAMDAEISEEVIARMAQEVAATEEKEV